jgi:V/A-type H+-transporting ATPase subunit I
MIGDVGYGLLYVFMGYAVYKKFDSKALSDFGAVVVWLGLWTTLFGFLYGEILGLHFIEQMGSEPVLKKGLDSTAWAISWLLVSVVAGWLHLNLGYIFNFVEEWSVHGAKPAIVEVGSWLLMLNGLWLFIFSKLGQGGKPSFLVGPDALFATGPLGFGFEGFPAILGIAGLVLFALGIVIIVPGPWYEVVEFLVPLAHTLSYTRLAAVLLAKAGMALAVNLLYFGAYRDSEGFHYMHTYAPGYTPKEGEVVFGGLANMGSAVSLGPVQLGIEGALLGLPVYIIGHAVVLAIGGTAAIQAVRLEYFEFFEKFYEGGGKKYEPFGHERTHTSDQ